MGPSAATTILLLAIDVASLRLMVIAQRRVWAKGFFVFVCSLGIEFAVALAFKGMESIAPAWMLALLSLAWALWAASDAAPRWKLVVVVLNVAVSMLLLGEVASGILP